ncbi:TPA: hypothetical protein ACJFUB_000588 [Yersinia enterocolitica]|uniref:Uncharacterized protein n=1 Tax=Yersinia enterocolitica TaxID=630 RepID=A0AAD2V1I5_YEREN|nr:hypothetical protein [Yersinia enterocolitica]EKN3530464.1 hypothetical protein [Yersinia enterocolitica]EKN6064183.1 hypothetical protein [Yersinia enterocolitica]ELI8103588.1 hypothetical protein [Yersinia enterocolitica]CQR10206.1 Uncharacterised protein [Yersinia enterocolitica]CRX55528.1 Uncharacterised protein [Yersinia enterocolitica]
MNQYQIDQVKTAIDSFYALNFEGILGGSFNKDELNYDTSMIGDYTINEYIVMVNKVFRHFIEELQDISFKSLPYQYDFNNEFGSGNLYSDMTTVVSYINSASFTSTVQILDRLVHYQRLNGFWEKSNRKYFTDSEDRNIQDREVLETLKSHLTKYSESFVEIASEINEKKDELSSFISAKQSELKDLEVGLSEMNRQNIAINELHNHAISTVEKINSQFNITESKRVDSEKLLNEARSELSTLQDDIIECGKKIASQDTKFNGLKASFEKSLDFVKGKEKYFEERNQYLDDLIGREVGASLFETFKQRKEELSPSVNFWKWAVPVLAIVTVVWIFILFYTNQGAVLSYQVIIINSLKALPVIGLLLFGISQYSRERNFQEEYAFKSAVALTLNSYASQLKNEENKDQLIMTSVNEIYKTPIQHSKIKASENKSLVDAVKELVDSTKNLVDNKK